MRREGKGLLLYPTAAVTGLAEGHILSFLAVHAETYLGWLLTGVQLELHLCHIVKEFGKMALDLQRETASKDWRTCPGRCPLVPFIGLLCDSH